jgi:dienelactone hydrolase
MISKAITVLFTCMFLSSMVAGAQTEPLTITYAIQGTDTLWLHHYQPKGKPNGITVLFVHGGSFTGGDPANQKPFADGLTKLGYNIFVIKYRLYLKGKSFGCETATPEKLKAIQTAVEDVTDAGEFIVQHASRYGVDTSRLFLAGSSAGAEAVLNTVFNPFKRKGEPVQHRYKGVISFAGAVLDVNTLSEKTWIPVLMMHGTRDQMVPFGTAAHRYCRVTNVGWLMMFGSHTILDEARKKGLPAVLYTFEGGGHEVCNYMFRRFQEMDDFMKTVVAKKAIKPVEIIIK